VVTPVRDDSFDLVADVELGWTDGFVGVKKKRPVEEPTEIQRS